MIKKAQEQFNFYETPREHALKIYDDYKPSSIVDVIDICCGLGSLVQPWYDNGHNITLIELNDDFIPILKNKYPRAKILNTDFLKSNIDTHYDIYLCNPPFNTKDEKLIYVSFFCKILNMMSDYSIFYFICPKMFYKNQNRIKIENEILNKLDIINYIKENNEMPAKYYYDKYHLIELHSNEFRFNKTMIKRMIRNNIIRDDFIDEETNMINPYYEFRYLGNIFNFETTKCKCGLFKINK
jgi:predicted RNA methylase